MLRWVRADSPNAKAMDNKLLLSLLIPALDNRTLEVFVGTSLWSIVSELVRSDYYWYQRVQHLSSREIKYRPGNWKVAYYLLSDVIHLRDPFTREVVSSSLAVSILIEIGFDPRSTQALHHSALDGRTDVVRLLLEDARSDPRADDSYALRLSSEKGHAEVIGLLLKDGRSDPKAIFVNTLGFASSEGHVELVKLLLENGVDPTVGNSYALVLACREGRIEVVRLLLEDRRADPSDVDSYALGLAAGCGRTEVVRLLLEDGRSDPRADDSYALRVARQGGHTEVVRLLLADGRVNAEIGEGR